MNRACDLDFSPLSVALTSWLVNGGPNHHSHRQQIAKFIANRLLDESRQIESINISYPRLPQVGIPVFFQTFPPTQPAFTENVMVHHDQQIP
jgi:hypothetical protein